MPASRHHALVRNIVNQLADLYSERIPSDEWVAVRQATNDEADAFVAKLLAEHDAETVRETAEKAEQIAEHAAGHTRDVAGRIRAAFGLASDEQRADHPHTDPGDGRSQCPTCGKYVWPSTHSCKGIRVAPDEASKPDGRSN